MLWWFLIMGVSVAVVASVVVSLYVRLRRQMKYSAASKVESDSLDQHSFPPEG